MVLRSPGRNSLDPLTEILKILVAPAHDTSLHQARISEYIRYWMRTSICIPYMTHISLTNKWKMACWREDYFHKKHFSFSSSLFTNMIIQCYVFAPFAILEIINNYLLDHSPESTLPITQRKTKTTRICFHQLNKLFSHHSNCPLFNKLQQTQGLGFRHVLPLIITLLPPPQTQQQQHQQWN